MHKSVVAAALIFVATTGAVAAQISGNYIEARTASVYVGACYANSETNLTGHEAVMGWQVANGSWDGVPLTGLSVAAVVRASATLGDPSTNAYPASSIVIVDKNATPEQSRALVAFVRSNAPRLFERIVHVEKAAIEFQVGAPSAHGNGHGHDSHGPVARLVVGDLARIVTRAFHEHDSSCANAEIYYQPLNPVTQVEPAVATTNEFKGEGLGKVWSISNRPSAFVGTFAR